MRHYLHCFLLLLCLVRAATAADATGNQKAVDDFNFAAWLYNSGKYGMAAESYQAFLQNFPDHAKAADARFGLAQSLFHQDKFKEASEQYDALRAKNADFPQMPEALFQLGQARVALKQFDTAREAFADLRKRFPDHYLVDWAAAREAACLISLGKPGDAEPLLKAFVTTYTVDGKSPEKAPATQAMLDKMEKAGIKAKEAFLDLVERTVFYRALSPFNQEKFAEARKAFQAFLEQYPDSKLADESRFRMAQCLYRENAFAEAAAAYKPVAEGKGEFAEAAAFERGLALHKAGKLKEASAAFGEMAGRFPASAKAPRARLYAGSFLYDAGDYAGAIDRLKPLAAAKAELADEAAYWLGMSLLKAGKAAEAEQALAAALQNFPKSPVAADVRLGLGDARLAQNKFEAAAQAFREFVQDNGAAEQAPRALYSAAAALHRAEKYAESDELCGQFMKSFEKNDLAPQVLFLSAEDRFLQKNYERAAEQYQALLGRRDAPADRSARSHYRMAWVHRYAKRYDAALAELAKVDARAAGKAVAGEADYLKGVCCFESQKFPEAVQALQAYLKTDDATRFGDDALLKLAAAQGKQGKPAEAMDSLERLLKQFPKSDIAPQAEYQLAEIAHEQKQIDKAVAHYRAVAGREPPHELSSYALFGIGVCAFEQGKWDEAAATFRQVADKYKGTDLAPQAFYRRGTSLTKAAKWGDAEQAFRGMLAVAPKHELARSAQVMIGSCLQNQKKWAEAAGAFQAAIDGYAADKDQARIYYELGWSLREAGKEKESLAAFDALAAKYAADPLAADAFFYLAEARYQAPQPETPEKKAKRLDEARGLYEKVLEISKDKRLDDKALYRVGWCHWLNANYKQAAAAFDRLNKEWASSDLYPDALFQAAQSFARDGDPAQAMARYTVLVDDARFADSKYRPDACIGLAECKLILGRPEETVKAVKTYLAKYEKHASLAQACFLMGKAQFELNDRDAALKSLGRVLDLTRSDLAAQAQFYVGQVHQSREDFKAANLAYLRVQALFPDSRTWVAASLFEGAKCSAALGNKDDARKAFQEVADKYKDTEWAPLALERLK